MKEVVDKALASGTRITQRPGDRMRRRISSKSKTYTEDVQLDVAGRSVKVFVHYFEHSNVYQMEIEKPAEGILGDAYIPIAI